VLQDDSIRYTALTGAVPKLEALRKKSAQEFPLAKNPPVFTQTPDGKIAARMVVEAFSRPSFFPKLAVKWRPRLGTA
jgi:hypothetical protein